jgi:1,2-phenylacetyl-CoA epoxidase catalytic subunit
MTTGKQFVKKLGEDFSTLYKVADITTRRYFEKNPSKDELLHYFKIRLFNERWNMVELSQAVANLPVDTPMAEAQMLSKQAYDEANHFRMVKEVVEHIAGEELDMNEVAKDYGKKMPSQGAYILDKYNAQDDELALALYQYLAEGRAAVVWQAMAESIPDSYVSRRYGKIAKDEKFHASIGRLKLEQLCESEENQKRALELAEMFIWDLYENTCLSITQVEEDLRTEMKEAYGLPNRELKVAL